MPPTTPGSQDEESGHGAWNQAVMELGATVCTPRSPKCLLCPVVASCEARALGREEELPRPGKKAEPIDVRLEVLVVRHGDQVLLQRRAAGGRMAGLWELPTREVTGGESRLWPTAFQGQSGASELATAGPLAEVSHGITRHRIRATVLEAEGGPVLDGELVPLAEAPGRGLTGMTKKILRRREVRAIFDD